MLFRSLRGRKPLEVAKLLQETAVEEGLPVEQTVIIPDEMDAFLKAWELSEPGDLLLFFYTDFSYVEQFFTRISEKILPKKY